MYIIRLDDASENMNIEKWSKIEKILDKYKIKPLVGVIPRNKDRELLKYPINEKFWELIESWKNKDWTLALHGYEHKYITDNGGINPIQYRSEFAGLSLKEQENKIKKGYEILCKHNIRPKVFFAPSHTFDNNTILALKNTTPIRIISDTIANNIYFENDFYFIPQQTGKARKLPFKIVTCCYHPNTMKENDFCELEKFIKLNINKVISFNKVKLIKRNRSIYDKILKKIYFFRRKQ